MEGIPPNGDTSDIGYADKTCRVNAARSPGFHTFLTIAIHVLAVIHDIRPSNALRTTSIAWIKHEHVIPSNYRDVYLRRTPLEQLNVHVDDRALCQCNEVGSTTKYHLDESKAHIQEFLELKANIRDSWEGSRRTDVATQYLEKRLSNIVKGVDNSGIVTEFGLNRYKSFTYILQDHELVEQVVELMRRYRTNKDEMTLFGEPIAIKDNIASRGIPYTNGSALLREFKPSYNAHVVEQLRRHGTIIIAKTAMNEFGVGSETKGTLNPFGSQYLPGGSSGGSATAVGGGILKMALGTDTGGSIRLPAAYCGCVGYRPSYGLLSRYGISELAAKLDAVGTCTQTVNDAIRLVHAMLQPCLKDATSSNDNGLIAKELLALLQSSDVTHINKKTSRCIYITLIPDAGHIGDELETEMKTPLKDVKIASLDLDVLLRDDLIQENVADNIRDVEKTLKRLGAQIITLTHPPLAKLCEGYHVYVASQMAANLQRFADQQYHTQRKHMIMQDMMQDMDGETVQRLKMGISILQEGRDPEQILKNARKSIAAWLSANHVFTDIPLLIMPVSFGLPPKRMSSPRPVSDIIKVSTAMAHIYNSQGDIYTTFAPLIGACSISVPSGITTTGLPYSVQFTAAPFKDTEMLKVARIYEANVDIHTQLKATVLANVAR
ncbi:amidase family protein [Babesia divergens]|uniref:Amidase family protein n=1 Tax=Babesia divergens TaxID=32595 RepID=A0AAD9G7E2_BABDI|nr:amidase family protein [Babesia divergens]